MISFKTKPTRKFSREQSTENSKYCNFEIFRSPFLYFKRKSGDFNRNLSFRTYLVCSITNFCEYIPTLSAWSNKFGLTFLYFYISQLLGIVTLILNFRKYRRKFQNIFTSLIFLLLTIRRTIMQERTHE